VPGEIPLGAAHRPHLDLAIVERREGPVLVRQDGTTQIWYRRIPLTNFAGQK
jgi:hypothetical protein